MSAQQSDQKPDWIYLVMSRLQAHYKRNSGEQSRLFLLMNQDVLFKPSPLTKLNVSSLVLGLQRGTLQTFNLTCVSVLRFSLKDLSGTVCVFWV